VDADREGRSAMVSLPDMNPTNAAVLKFVLDSPIGAAMSAADRQALAATLATTDARDVDGWFGAQIRKAAVAAVEKGDYVGHPFRGNQYADASGASTGGASGTGPVVGEAKMSGKAKVDTMFSDSDNKKVATAFTAWVKSKKFPADHQITSKEINEFADSMQGKVGSEITDTAVREQLAEQYHEQTGIPYKARQSRDDSNRAKREALQEKRTQARAAAEAREAKETERRGGLKPLNDDDIDKELPATEAKRFAAGVKATRAAVERTDGVIVKLRGQWSKKFGSNPRSQDAQDAAAAIKEAQEVTDRIREMVENIGDRASIGHAVRLTQMGVNEAELAKGALREAQDLVAPSRARSIGGGWTSTKPRSAAAESRDLKDVYALQDAMDRDFGVSRDKYDVDGLDFDKIYDIGR